MTTTPTTHSGMTFLVTFMSGAGNLFSVLDNRNEVLSSELLPSIAARLCASNAITKQPCEGVVVVKLSDDKTLDFAVDFYNPDGSSSMMCGNGARCAVRFALSLGILDSKVGSIRFSMAGAIYSATVNDNEVAVRFPAPNDWVSHINLPIGNMNIQALYIHNGSDHIVIDNNHFKQECLRTGTEQSFLEIAQILRHHVAFPQGTNVNIYEIQENKTITLQTYERGVEAITGACGTGALATGFALWLLKDFPANRIIIEPPSGDLLFVFIHIAETIETNTTQHNPETIVGMTLAGSAIILGQTEFTL